MLNKLVELIRSLNANAKPSQIASSFCIGLLLGFMPKDNLLWFMLVVFFAFVRINKAGYWIFILIGSIFAHLLDPLFDTVGYAVLTFKPLEGFFSWWIDVPFLGFTQLNNTIVCGSLVCSLVLFVPLYFVFLALVALWRKTIAPAFNNSKVLKTLYQIPLIAKIAGKIN